jgi:hypothetical protein
LAVFHISDLHQHSLIPLDFPTHLGKPLTPQLIYLQIFGGLVLRCTLFGNGPEKFHHPTIIQIDHRANRGDVLFPDWSIVSLAGFTLLLCLHLVAPTLAFRFNPYQVPRASLPAVKM